MHRCPECSSSLALSGQKKEVICRNCGLVIDDVPLNTCQFIPEGVKNQASLPGLATAGTMPTNGRIIQHQWLFTTREKNLYKARKQLETISSKLKLPKAVEQDAYAYFKTTAEKNINIGRDNKTMLFGCVYAACIMHGIPKTSLELTAFTDVDKTKILRAYKLLKTRLNLKVDPIDPLDFVHRFGSRLDLKQDTISLAAQIITRLKGTPVVAGKNPKSVVASALYIASKMNDDYRTQREVSIAAGIIEVTLRLRTKEIEKLIL